MQLVLLKMLVHHYKLWKYMPWCTISWYLCVKYIKKLLPGFKAVYM